MLVSIGGLKGRARPPGGKHKVVLYNPEAVFYTMPLGLLAVGSALDPERFEVTIVDGRLDSDPVSRLIAETEGALCLGVSVLTGAPIRDALRISRAIKAVRPDLPVVWGGWHPSLFPTQTLDEPSIDVTVQGQGEVTFVELVEQLAAGGDLDGVQGLTYRRGGAAIQNPARELANVDSLPRHEYGLIEVERYFTKKKMRQFDYISSAGCFFRCAFCADPLVYGRRWAAVGPERMGEEIEGLWRRWRFEELAFQDETFFTYKKRAVGIAEAFLKRKLNFRWTATMRGDQGVRLGDDAFALCVRSGLSRAMIGVESGSQKLLDWMQKDTKIDQIVACAEMCARHRVGAIFPFIVGFPNETEEMVEDSLRLIKELRAMSPQFETPVFFFKPYPGSRITQEAVAAGYALPNDLEGWAEFDFIGSSGPWVTPDRARKIERFKFYNRFAWGRRTPLRWPLQQVARWRMQRDFFGLPIEKFLVERLKPEQRLS